MVFFIRATLETRSHLNVFGQSTLMAAPFRIFLLSALSRGVVSRIFPRIHPEHLPAQIWAVTWLLFIILKASHSFASPALSCPSRCFLNRPPPRTLCFWFPQGAGTNDEVLIEILASRTGEEIKRIIKVYKTGDSQFPPGKRHGNVSMAGQRRLCKSILGNWSQSVNVRTTESQFFCSLQTEAFRI